MAVRPLCQVKDGGGSFVATTDGVSVTAGQTLTIRLADVTDVVAWFLVLTGTDETTFPPALASVNPSTNQVSSPGAQVTFTLPGGAGRALIFESTVTGPGGPQVTTFALYVPTTHGYRVGATGEQREGSTSYGWVTKLNPLIRQGAPVVRYDDTMASPTLGASTVQGALDALKALTGGFTAGGDLSGSSSSQTVIGLRGVPLDSTPPTDGQVITYSSSLGRWVYGAVPSGSFTAGGDLSGSTTSQTVNKIKNLAIIGFPSNGQVLTYSNTGPNLYWSTVSGGGGGVFPAIFGTGADGSATVSGTVTYTRDMHFTDLTVHVGGKIVVAGFRIYVQNTLTIDAGGILTADGADGVGRTGGGTAGGGGDSTMILGGGAEGGAGGTAGQGDQGQTFRSAKWGGDGGAGGQGYRDLWPGGAPSPDVGLPVGNPPDLEGLLGGFWRTRTGAGLQFYPWDGGGAGGGGGGGAAGDGGKGGGGGGVIALIAKNLVNNGVISANGGNGADADPAWAGGGGGGGGGGVVTLFVKTYTGLIARAFGGAGGLKGNGSPEGGSSGNVNGSPGSDGKVYVFEAS
jgi:hypothetical protein